MFEMIMKIFKSKFCAIMKMCTILLLVKSFSISFEVRTCLIRSECLIRIKQWQENLANAIIL